MEKSVIDLTETLKEAFGGGETDLRTYSPLTLAYIGDGIYDLVIRTLMVWNGNCQPNKLHKRTSALVKASTQAAIADSIFEELTEEEQTILKRGRNAKSYTMAKNSSMKDYRKATGFEALMGYLYLEGNLGRLVDLVKMGVEAVGKEEKIEREGGSQT